jgi:hypothetical protein
MEVANRSGERYTQSMRERYTSPVTATPVANASTGSSKRLAVAFAVAAASDLASIWTAFAPPAQWAVDLATALLLYRLLGRRWATLGGLVAEAIPGVAVFPSWILVVLSIGVFDEIRRPAAMRLRLPGLGRR